MATGDVQDMQSRLRAALPQHWFADNAPVLQGLQTGVAWAMNSAYGNITYTALQTRIKTATGIFLDIIANDFFDGTLPRLMNEGDDAFRARILANLFVKGPTRGNMSRVLTLLTGKTPAIFEPSNTTDSGGWDGYFYWDIDGGWGDPLPYQSFITVYRPSQALVSLAEWDAWRFTWDVQAYWSDASPNAITDAALIAAVESTRALGTIVWMRIADSPVTP